MGIGIGIPSNCTQFCLGHDVQIDLSGGEGHCWVHADEDNLPEHIAMEIAAEMIDGGVEECRDYLAANGQHYRW